MTPGWSKAARLPDSDVYVLPDPESFVQAFAAIASRRFMFRKDLAEALFVDRALLSRWLSGKSRPPVWAMWAIVRVLGFDIVLLRNGARPVADPPCTCCLRHPAERG